MPDKWVPGTQIERVVMAHTKYSGSYTNRELRKLGEEGFLKRQERPWQGKTLAWYCYSQTDTWEAKRLGSIKWFDELADGTA